MVSKGLEQLRSVFLVLSNGVTYDLICACVHVEKFVYRCVSWIEGRKDVFIENIFYRNASECCSLSSATMFLKLLSIKKLCFLLMLTAIIVTITDILICCHTNLKSFPAFPSKLVATALLNFPLHCRPSTFWSEIWC